jgi:dihydroorotate dehydrogenase
MYKFLRYFLFKFEAERVHYFAMNSLKRLCNIGLIRKRISPVNTPQSTSVFGLHFRNPVGLAAGFDKNAKYLRELDCLGFGFVEIGTVTPLPQDGNPKPRLFRVPKDRAIINRMGFNNDGVQIIAERLKEWRNSRQSAVSSRQPADTSNLSADRRLETGDCQLIIGGNIGKNKTTPNEYAWKDYETCFNVLFDYVDYFVVNVSSPNTPGLRQLQEKESLKKILTHLQSINRTKSNPKPLLLKIAPDLTTSQIDDVAKLALEIKLDGIVATNTTIERGNLCADSALLGEHIGSGGLSGAPLKERSTEVVWHIHKKTNGQIPIIASGGIFTGRDAKEKLNAGASLVQVWTAFIYEGPSIVKKIRKELN